MIVPFSRLSKRERNRLKLKWIVKDFSIALDAVNGNGMVTEKDITSLTKVRYLDSLGEKSVNYATVKKYCTKDAYAKAQCLLKKVSEKISWHCGICKKIIKGRCISCNRCLQWFHFQCSTVLDIEFANWYCGI